VRLVSDENFNGEIVRGLLLRRPSLDLCRVQDVGLQEADDPAILEWAAANNRIVLTHDRATMPDFAYARVAAGRPMPGVFVLNDRLAIRQAIEALLLIEACSEQTEWGGVGRVSALVGSAVIVGPLLRLLDLLATIASGDTTGNSDSLDLQTTRPPPTLPHGLGDGLRCLCVRLRRPRRRNLPQLRSQTLSYPPEVVVLLQPQP
jgi:predicted nuclease of predicted toxin-antitoxin system